MDIASPKRTGRGARPGARPVADTWCGIVRCGRAGAVARPAGNRVGQAVPRGALLPGKRSPGWAEGRTELVDLAATATTVQSAGLPLGLGAQERLPGRWLRPCWAQTVTWLDRRGVLPLGFRHLLGPRWAQPRGLSVTLEVPDGHRALVLARRACRAVGAAIAGGRRRWHVRWGWHTWAHDAVAHP